jgi:hypothetical protein
MENSLEALKTAPKCLAMSNHRTTLSERLNANVKCKMHNEKSTGRLLTHGLHTKKNIKNTIEKKYLIYKMATTF